ncbi:RPH1 [Scenedesmus sp. PABB004]|nr:RPH1 [Scenedesmus sp. PABB004]
MPRRQAQQLQRGAAAAAADAEPSSSDGGGASEPSDDGDHGAPDLDAGFDADAEGGLSSSDGGDDEPPSSSDGGAGGAAPGGGPAAGAAAADGDAFSDSELDADLDADDGPSSSGGGSDDDDEGLDDGDAPPGSSDPGSSESGGEGEGGPRGGAARASFLDGGKAASFAKAFSKIMDKPAKAAGGGGGGGILSESASLAKRKAEAAADDAAARGAKRARQELRKRGHLRVPRKGEDPAADAREKQLQKLATRGVVLLFNAVNKAQKAKRDADAAGGKAAKGAAKASRAGFLAELKAGGAAAAAAAGAGAGAGDERLVPGGRPRGAAPAPAAGSAGWSVLGEGFPGLSGGVKMKDWDKAAPSDDEPDGAALAGSDDGGSDDGEGCSSSGPSSSKIRAMQLARAPAARLGRPATPGAPARPLRGGGAPLRAPRLACRAEQQQQQQPAAAADGGGEAGPTAGLDKQLSKLTRQTAGTFAPRSSTAKGKNPAVKGSALYTVFEVQAWAAVLAGGLLSFNLIWPTDEPAIPRLLGMWSVWMFTIPSLRARDCSAAEKDALNLLFLLVPLINVALPFVWKSFGFIFAADVAALVGVYAAKGVWAGTYGIPLGAAAAAGDAPPPAAAGDGAAEGGDAQ